MSEKLSLKFTLTEEDLKHLSSTLVFPDTTPQLIKLLGGLVIIFIIEFLSVGWGFETKALAIPIVMLSISLCLPKGTGLKATQLPWYKKAAVRHTVEIHLDREGYRVIMGSSDIQCSWKKCREIIDGPYGFIILEKLPVFLPKRVLDEANCNQTFSSLLLDCVDQAKVRIIK